MPGSEVALESSLTLRAHVESCARCTVSMKMLATGSKPIVEPDASAAMTSVASAVGDGHDIYFWGGELGRGGMGSVFAGRDLRSGREVALKVLLTKDRSQEERLRKEAMLAAKLSHPAILPVYELGRDSDGALYVAMRRIVGATLETSLSGNLSDRLRLLKNVATAADAVHHAHQRGIIHRDITPANILVTSFGDTQIIDWGLGKRLDELEATPTARADIVDVIAVEKTHAGAVMGTAQYMSPEQARGEPVDAKADIYALGAVLYRVVAGRPPYQEPTLFSLINAVRTRAPDAVVASEAAAPPQLIAIIDRAMARDANARYQTAAQFADDIRAFINDDLVAAWSLTRTQRLGRWLRRNRLTVIAALVISAVVVTAASVAASARYKARNHAQQQQARADDLLWYTLHDVHASLDSAGKLDTLDAIIHQVEQASSGEPRQPLAQAELRRAKSSLANQRGDSALASKLCDEALQLAATTIDANADLRWIENRASCLVQRGAIAATRNEPIAAQASFEAALQFQWQIMLRSGDPLLSPAVALQRLGDLVVTERPRDALVFYQRAAAMLRLMRAQHPANRLLQRDAIAVAVAIADAYNTSNEFAQAVEAYQAALQSGTAWFATNSANAVRDQAIILQRLSSIHRQLEHPEALRFARQAHAHWTQLAERDPSNLNRQEDLMISYRNLAEQLQTTDGLEAARGLRAAVAIGEKLVVADPARGRWQQTLFDLCYTQSEILSGQEDYVGARAALVRAGQVLTTQLALQPTAYPLIGRNALLHYQAAVLEINASAPLPLQAAKVAAWIVATHAAVRPDDQGRWGSILVEANVRLSDIEQRRSRRSAALAALRAAQQAAATIQPPNQLAPHWATEMQKLQRKMSRQ